MNTRIKSLEHFVEEYDAESFKRLASSFNCYEERDNQNICANLNYFIQNKALFMAKNGVVSTFLLLNPSEDVLLGFCSLQTGAVEIAKFYRKNQPRLKEISEFAGLTNNRVLFSAIELICFAVKNSNHCRGYGRALMNFVFNYVATLSHQVGCTILCASHAAKTAENFYQRCGFNYGDTPKPSMAPERDMVLPVCTIRHLMFNNK